jgi:hypothetical protein
MCYVLIVRGVGIVSYEEDIYISITEHVTQVTTDEPETLYSSQIGASFRRIQLVFQSGSLFMEFKN